MAYLCFLLDSRDMTGFALPHEAHDLECQITLLDRDDTRVHGDR